MNWLKRLLRESPPVTSIEFLKKEMAQLMAEIKNCYDQIAQLQCENDKLKKEIDRLKTRL